jgi:hypothetical protein
MRKIEEQMLEAIYNKALWSKDNTEVLYVAHLNQSYIYLHGHPIALYDYKEARVIPDLDTLEEWPTVTTKSRLRALGVNVATRKGVTYVDNKEVAQ